MADAAGPRRSERIVTGIVVALCAAAAAVIVVTTLRALDRWYLPVPVADTWEGSFGFTREAAGDFLGALWRPHNEHRIVLSKLLFWFNNTHLGGSNAFLIAVNVALTAAVAAATAWLTAAMVAGHRAAQWIFAAASMGAGFAWVHQQNLVWEFQSQFYFAVLFSLLAMTLAGRAHVRGDSSGRYLAAVACALLAMVSMGAGVPTVAALGLVLLVLPAPRRVIVAAGVVLVVGLGLFLPGLGVAPANPDALQLLPSGEVPAPVALLTFLGSPAYWATESLGWAQVGGALFLAVTAAVVARTARQVWRRQERAPMTMAGLGFVLVVLANGISAALLRADNGALVLVGSRYQILVLIGWLVLMAVAVASTMEVLGPVRSTVATGLAAGAAAAVLLLVVPTQLASGANPADPDQSTLANPARRTAAALGVELGVPDRDLQVPTLYYRPGAWPALSEYVREQQWAIFGDRFRELRQTLGGSQEDLRHVPCEAVVDAVAPVLEDPSWSIVRGRVVGEAGEVPELVQFRDPAGVIVGYASTGFHLEQPLTAAEAARYGGFRGYARTEAAGDLRVVCAWR